MTFPRLSFVCRALFTLVALLYLNRHSTAVMDFLARPPPAAPAASLSDAVLASAKDTQSDALYPDAYRQSWGSDGGSDDSEDDRVPPPRVKGYAGGSRRSFASGETGVSAAGEAVAVAALASDYGAWLKRLAVRLRRATPAGGRFVRLRRIGPAVTGEQVSECYLNLTRWRFNGALPRVSRGR